MKVSNKEVKLLVDWAVNIYGKITHYLKNGWLQLESYELFLKQMREIHGNHRHWDDYIKVSFNDPDDRKVHFKIYPYFTDEKIISYERFSKSVWNYLKNNQAEKSYVQLSLF